MIIALLTWAILATAVAAHYGLRTRRLIGRLTVVQCERDRLKAEQMIRRSVIPFRSEP